MESTPTHDERGFFVRTLSADILASHGVDTAAFVQENQSRSRHRTLRGLHFRKELRERKIIRCARGAAVAAVVDLRPWSLTFGQTVVATLDDVDHRQLVVPPGCALGFQVVSQWADMCYKHDAVYAPELDGSLAWNDPQLSVPWPLSAPLLSDRDRVAPPLAELEPHLEQWFGSRPPDS